MIARASAGGPPYGSTVAFWTIYQRPSDAPVDCEFVVRRCWLAGLEIVHSEVGFGCASLEVARSIVPPEATRIGAMPDDDPVIVETWME